MWSDSQSFSASSSSRAVAPGKPAPMRSPKARSTLSRVTAAILESFAEYGEAMYPSLFELGEYQAGSAEMRTPYARGLTRRYEEVAPEPSADLEGMSVTVVRGPWRLRPLSRLWAACRRAHRRRQTRIMLESLDDSTLHDIGLPRCQIDRVVTHENFY